MLKLNDIAVPKIYLNGVSCLAAYLNGVKVFDNIIDTFKFNVAADGGTLDTVAFDSEYNSLHSLIKSGARYILIAGAWKTNTVYALDASNGSIVKFSVTRAGTATYYDKNGDMQTAAAGQPRIDYHPRTLALRGYLVEGSATNYDSNSNSFPATANWTSVTANAIIYKGLSYTQGTSSSSANNIKSISGTVPALTGGVTLSIHVKLVSGTNDNIGWFIFRTGGNGLIRVSASTGNLIANTTGLTPTVTSLDLGNGFYRVSLMLPGWTDGGTVSFGYSGFTLLVSSHQMESSTVATSYMPTSGSQFTRVGESTVTCEKDLLNDTAATGYAQMIINRNGTTYNLIRNASSTGSIWYETGVQNALARDSVNTINRNAFVTDGQSNKVVTSYGANGLRMTANGSAVTNAAYVGAFGVTAPTKILYSPATGVVRCHVKTIAIFTSQISDADMITIST